MSKKGKKQAQDSAAGRQSGGAVQRERTYTGSDPFIQKRTQNFGGAQRCIHTSGQDSIFSSDSFLVDCNRQEKIYCYVNRGSEWEPEGYAAAYRGVQTEDCLWYFDNGKPVYDVAIDRRCRYAAVAAGDGIYIVDADPKCRRYYPDEGQTIRPADWGALKGFAGEKNVELAFDENDLLHVREYPDYLCPEDNGGDNIRYVLDIDKRRALDEDGVLRGALEDRKQLTELALYAPDPEIRFLAMQCMDDETLECIYATDDDDRVQLAAVHCMRAQTALADIAVNAPDADVRKAAVSRLSDMALLEKIYFEMEPVKEVRYAAWGRLKTLKGEK